MCIRTLRLPVSCLELVHDYNRDASNSTLDDYIHCGKLNLRRIAGDVRILQELSALRRNHYATKLAFSIQSLLIRAGDIGAVDSEYIQSQSDLIEVEYEDLRRAQRRSWTNRVLIRYTLAWITIGGGLNGIAAN